MSRFYAIVFNNGENVFPPSLEDARRFMAKEPDVRVRSFPGHRRKAAMKWVRAVSAERRHEFQGLRHSPRDFNKF